MREANSQDSPGDSSEAAATPLAFAMRQVLGDRAMRIGKRELSISERDSMSLLVLGVPGRIPFESRHHQNSATGACASAILLYGCQTAKACRGSWNRPSPAPARG